MNSEPEVDKSYILSRPGLVIPFEEGLTGRYVVVDVRSAKDFLEGTYPGAVNIPIFDDEQRALVGTIYRHGGHDQAVETGFQLVQSRLSELVECFEKYRGEHLAVFCARGGMRSRSVVNLLNKLGFTAWQLEGGYKSYRHLVQQTLENFKPRLIVLHGHTGTGKTRILQRLENGIDLEDLAQHQSSLFGGLNRKPRNQKGFDSCLCSMIPFFGEEPYFIEGESRKMGNIYLPAGLAEAMHNGHLVFISCALEKRVERIVEDYPIRDEETRGKIRAILRKLRPRLGGKVVDHLCRLLEVGDLHELVRILLADYYDKRYDNCFADYRFDLEINSDDIDSAAARLTEYRRSLQEASE